MSNKVALTLASSIALSADDLNVLAEAVSALLNKDMTLPKKKSSKKVVEEEPENEATKERVVELLEEVVKEIGKKEAKALLKAFDAKNIKTLDEEYYADFIASAEEMLEEDDDDDDDSGDDDDDDDDDDSDEEDDDFDRDEIKKSIQRIATKDKESAVDILQAGKLNTVRGIARASDEAMERIWKALKKYNKV